MDKLEKLFDDIHTPGHSSWLKHLTANEIHAMTAMPANEIEAIKEWLGSAGSNPTIKYNLASGALQFTANISVINQLFNTTMAIFTHKTKGKTGLAHIGSAYLPDRFVGKIEFADGLHWPLFTPDRRGGLNGTKAVNNTGSSRRLLQSSSATTQVFPANSLYAYYNSDDQSSFVKSSSYQSNTSVSVIQFDETYSVNDLAEYSSFWSTTQSNTTLRIDSVVGYNDGGSYGSGEASLDVQSLSSFNPKTSANFENVGDGWIYDWAVNFVARENIPQIVSISYGEIEIHYTDGAQGAGTSYDGIPPTMYLDRTNQLLMKIGALGTTIIVASGDDGASSFNNPTCDYSNGLGLYSVFPATSPYVTSVGKE